ncbi:hypothetical protein [Phenylobacterium deserti]|uniref:ACT domain-containing protein n=1 Tax=Phenylobacterium deserti TaxID=1914756 RepID=A0A328ACE9_9CAUL|nr:hypothetical protein [Phenylobacterium deserti]RAK52483.1 hypothetical protein DJ018_09720 [Phenylobacterium deserti]
MSAAENFAQHHVLTFAASHTQAALQAVEDFLARSGAALAGLRMRSVGEIVETTLQIQDLSDASAEAAGERLANRAGVSALRVEHVRPLK